jgi:hypothetical protein
MHLAALGGDDDDSPDSEGTFVSLLFRSCALTGFVTQPALWALAIWADGSLSRALLSTAFAQPFLLILAVTASFVAAVAEPRREPYLRAAGGLLAGTALFFLILVCLVIVMAVFGEGFTFAPPV